MAKTKTANAGKLTSAKAAEPAQAEAISKPEPALKKLPPAAKPKPATVAKPAAKKPAQAADKAAKSGKTAEGANGAAKPKSETDAKEKARKPKLVRDSFTMPEAEYAALGEVKKACLKAGIEVKKSQLLRVGVALVRQLEISKLKDILAGLPELKAGRPKK